MQLAKQKGRKSAYVRYNKAPYVYSPAYYSWRSAVKAGDKAKIRQADEVYFRQFMQA